MPIRKLTEFLDQNRTRYVRISHSPAYTAQEIAASAHVPGRELAKTVIVKLDGRMAMVVLPASYQIDLEQLRRATGAHEVELASENEFRGMFPECELGAMPPFGNLFEMPVVISNTLAEDPEIVFNAGSHQIAFEMAFEDFRGLVEPTIAAFTRPLSH
jgi:Ala-tRNA(Pro) deacylase